MRESRAHPTVVTLQAQELRSSGDHQASPPERWEQAGRELIAQALRAGHQTRFRVTGTSMLPSIWPGDVLIVSPLSEATPATGEVVLFLRNGRLFAHRVTARSGNQLITRGDALTQCDAPVSAGEQLGVVTGVVRDRGSTRVRSVPAIRHDAIAIAIRHGGLTYRLIFRIRRLALCSARFFNSVCRVNRGTG